MHNPDPIHYSFTNITINPHGSDDLQDKTIRPQFCLYTSYGDVVRDVVSDVTLIKVPFDWFIIMCLIIHYHSFSHKINTIMQPLREGKILVPNVFHNMSQ